MSAYLNYDIMSLIGKQVVSIRREADRDYHTERHKIYLSKGKQDRYDWWAFSPLYTEDYRVGWTSGSRSVPRPNKRGERVIAFQVLQRDLALHLGDGRRKWVKDKHGHYGKPNAKAPMIEMGANVRGYYPNPEIYRALPSMPLSAFEQKQETPSFKLAMAEAIDMVDALPITREEKFIKMYQYVAKKYPIYDALCDIASLRVECGMKPIIK